MRQVSGAEVDIDIFRLATADEFGGNHSDAQALFRKGGQELPALGLPRPKHNAISKLFARELLNKRADDALRSVAETRAGIDSARASDKADVCKLTKANLNIGRAKQLARQVHVTSKGLAHGLSSLLPQTP